MPKKSDDQWKPDDRGRYPRKVGWWINTSGKRAQYPFKFGTNLDKAKARLARVRELWAHEEERLKQPKPTRFPPLPSDLNGQKPDSPLWSSDGLWIAMELAEGKVQIVVPKGDIELEEAYAHRIHTLAQKYPFIIFVPEDKDVHDHGADFWTRAAEFRLNEIRQLSPNVLPEVTERFHDALDAYSEYAKKAHEEPTVDGPTLSSYGAHIDSNVRSLKRHQADVALSTLDDEGCQRLLDYWRNRPQTIDKRIKPAHPMSKDTCENHIAELMRFFRWLHKNKKYGWRKPEDFDELQTKVKEFSEERTEVTHLTKRKAYLPSELTILNKYATPLERLLILLGLNCGMKGAEQGTLQLGHLFLDQIHPNVRYLQEVAKFTCEENDRFLIYSRNKTKVYGEFLLWPQTVEMLRWAAERHKRIVEKHNLSYKNLLLTEKGTLFHRLTSGKKNRSQIFGNKWKGLWKRVRKDHADFPWFPFSTLRDTASDLVRQAADGEVAAVFLMHGKPVKKDDLLDLYTKRPFGKLFEALRTLQHDTLKEFFEAAPEQVTVQPVQQYTTLSKRERIVRLMREGVPAPKIAEEVGVSKATVTRTLTKYYYKVKK